MAAETQTGMDRAEMKRFLLKSKQEPVNCAIGVGDDKSVALLMLARSRSPKALQGDLQKEFPSAFNTRFGTAVVDTDDDPTLVKFMLNKAVTSMARRLVKTLKGTGFRKVQILLEDGSPVEVAAEEEAAEQADTSAPDAPQPDTTALAAALATLVPRIADIADPAQKEVLAKQARLVNVNIKTGNLTYAATGIEQLRRTLDANAAATSSAAAEPADRSAQPPVPPPPVEEAKPDPAALSAALAILVPRIAQVTDAVQKEALAKQARVANVNIKTGNLTYAATGIEQLRRALDAIPVPTSDRPTEKATEAPPRRASRKPPESYVSIRGREIWGTARDKADEQIEALKQRLSGMPDPELQRLATFSLSGTTSKRSWTLLAALSEVDGVPADRQPAARAKARSVIGEFRAYLQADPLIQLLDDNPLKELVTIRATLGAALTEIDQTIAG